MCKCMCEFRFYEELNDYLPPGQRKRTITREITGTPSVKDAIEALGVPHTEIDLILIDGRLPLPPTLGVGGEGLLQLVRQPQVIDHEPAGLVLEHAIDSGDGLHEPVTAHRLVGVHRVQTRRVEAR